jgi:hypothetical protein
MINRGELKMKREINEIFNIAFTVVYYGDW